MKNGLKQFFLNRSTLMIFETLALFMWFVWTMCCFVIAKNNYKLAVDGIFYIALITGLFTAFKKGETNVQKVLLGALFMLLCNSNVEILLAYADSGDTVILIVDIISLVLALLFFISHIILQSDHAGKTGLIILNQFCGLILVVLMFYAIRQIAVNDKFPWLDITFIIPWALTYMIMICIETRVQVYKKLRKEARENGSWDDEARKEAKEIFKL